APRAPPPGPPRASREGGAAPIRAVHAGLRVFVLMPLCVPLPSYAAWTRRSRCMAPGRCLSGGPPTARSTSRSSSSRSTRASWQRTSDVRDRCTPLSGEDDRRLCAAVAERVSGLAAPKVALHGLRLMPDGSLLLLFLEAPSAPDAVGALRRSCAGAAVAAGQETGSP
ncbi:unnamed protein product, partial [Prorocentrum cordatum]